MPPKKPDPKAKKEDTQEELTYHYRVSYQVTCRPDFTVFDLFSMIETGFYKMATGRGDVPIVGIDNMTVSQNETNTPNVYKIQFIVEFPEDDDSSHFIEYYLSLIKDEQLFKNGSFVPIENTFNITPHL